MTRLLTTAACLAALAFPACGYAQTSPGSGTNGSEGSGSPSSRSGTTTQPGTPTPPTVPPTGDSVGSGVIVPPRNVDPGMSQAHPAPGAFPTPVVPPPGTPANRPDVVPK